jgi:microcystin-dependent protein
VAIDFPNTPSVNDEFTAGSKTWKWDGSAWRLVSGTGVGIPLDDLTDVGITTPQNGEFLEYDGSEWVNATGADSEPIGHEDKSESVISFNEATRTFSIAPSVTSYTVWCKGVRYVKTTTETVTIPDTTGLYYIYFNASGVLSYKTTFFTWDEDTPTAYVYWNATDDKAYFFADERHGITLDWATHEYLHRTRGAAIANGFGASAYTLLGDGTSDSDAQLDIANGTFFDEDLQVDIVHSATPTADTWEQVLQGAAEIPVFYKIGAGEWVADAPTTFPLKEGESLPAYNAFSGGVWSKPDLPNNSFGISYILATNNLNYPIIAVLGQASYGEKGAAEAAFYESLNLDGFPVVEFRPLYKVIYECKDSYTNNPKAAFREVTDLRSIISGGFGIPTVPVSDHGNMTGLGDDDHTQYLNTARHDSHDHSTAMGTVVLDDISNVSASAPDTGDFLKFDGTSWVPDSVPTINSLDDVGDVTITSVTSGQVIGYDGSGWVNANLGVPSGSITQFAASSAPTGWLICDGSNVSRTTYAALFAVIGTTYGSGDGSTTFGIPNLKGRIPVGFDSGQAEFDGLGETGGAKTHTLTVNEMPSHTHTQNAHAHSGTTSTAGAHTHTYNEAYNTSGMGPAGSYGFYHYARLANTSSAGDHSHSFTTNNTTATNQNTGGGAAHNNLQPYLVLNYIIKT